MLPSLLIAASAAIALFLGSLHLVYTFAGPKLRPRDSELEARMKAVHPVLTSQTTMWKAWIGFNASHSFGILLFGAVYGFLALAHPELLFSSPFLALLGGAFLLGYVGLGKAYWFSVPVRAVLLAGVLYGAGFIVALMF